jgi:hypothetical protein
MNQLRFNTVNTRAIISVVLAGIICLYTVMAGAQDSQDAIDLAWDWAPGDTGYTSGPNGDVAHALYLRSAADSDYAYDYPAVDGVDDCWWEIDHYTCQATLEYPFDAGQTYYVVAVAYLAETPDQRSLASNEISYRPGALDPADPGSGQPALSGVSDGGGGGCFLEGMVGRH